VQCRASRGDETGLELRDLQTRANRRNALHLLGADERLRALAQGVFDQLRHLLELAIVDEGAALSYHILGELGVGLYIPTGKYERRSAVVVSSIVLKEAEKVTPRPAG
jgi:hypothetical protein